jgi:hypothetical protein
MIRVDREGLAPAMHAGHRNPKRERRACLLACGSGSARMNLRIGGSPPEHGTTVRGMGKDGMIR